MKFTSKRIWVIATVGAVALTYAMVASNAFADTVGTTTPTVTTPLAPSTPTDPIVEVSPLSTLPSAATNESDVQVGEQSVDANQSGDNADGEVSNGDSGEQSTAGENDNSVDQSGANQDGSGTEG